MLAISVALQEEEQNDDLHCVSLEEARWLLRGSKEFWETNGEEKTVKFSLTPALVAGI